MLEKKKEKQVKTDDAIKENRLFIDTFSLNPHNNAMCQLCSHEFTSEENRAERSQITSQKS